MQIYIKNRLKFLGGSIDQVVKEGGVIIGICGYDDYVNEIYSLRDVSGDNFRGVQWGFGIYIVGIMSICYCLFNLLESYEYSSVVIRFIVWVVVGNKLIW